MTANDRRPGVQAWLRSRPLATQLAVLCALVTAVVAGTAFVILRAETAENVRSVFIGEVAATQRSLRQLQSRNLRLLLSTSSFVSTNPSLRAAVGLARQEPAVGTRRRDELIATIQREVDRIYDELDSDLLVVTDEAGLLLAQHGGGRDLAPGRDLSKVPVVRYALNAERATADSSFGVFRGEAGPLQVSVVAILVNGFPIGALMLGERLDRLMPSPDATLGTQAVVSAGDRVLLSTLPEAPAGAQWNALGTGGGGTPDSVRSLRLGAGEYVAASLPLGLTEEGRPAALHLVRSLSSSLAPVEYSLSTSFLAAGLAAVLLVGVGAAVMSRATLRPLSRFVEFMRSGADAQPYPRFVDPHPAAEVGTLTSAYNGLIESLSAQHAQLEQRSEELALALDKLRAEVRERGRAQLALRRSEEQLRQSQKLESLGTLAGGVAHDFNNLLGVIMGYAALSATNTEEGSSARADLDEIRGAAERAAALVKQLLAFSRKQVLQPQILDLNRIVSGTQSLLRPLLGEDVALSTELGSDLSRVMADPGQIEQVIVNLAVNARDAMPKGGRIIIETANVWVDERGDVIDVAAGGTRMVMLSVRDTGVGMDAATRERIFEPFYTTKAPGKGTGLGLSTVYGIVRQSEGLITVESAPGQGCTIRCLFPAANPEARPRATPAGGIADLSRGSETVLIAEDEPQLRTLMRRTLSERGYTVLDAADGLAAMALADSHRGPIDLLLTDVVMPNLSGVDLAARLQAERPGLRVIFISGYSDDAIERHGVLAPDSVFIQKPIPPDRLARMVRDLLDSPTTRGDVSSSRGVQ
jgi:signal transduction histidine kinase/ActR/RegA family two-component response regulator